MPTLDLGDAFARPYHEGDASALCAAVRETGASLAQWLDWYRSDYSETDAAQWIAHCIAGWASDEQFTFALFDAADRRFLGAVGINHRNRTHNFAGIGYWIRASARGRGLAARLGRKVAAFGFEQVRLARIEIVAAVDNLASRRTAERIGARLEGIQRQRLRVGASARRCRTPRCMRWYLPIREQPPDFRVEFTTRRLPCLDPRCFAGFQPVAQIRATSS